MADFVRMFIKVHAVVAVDVVEQARCFGEVLGVGCAELTLARELFVADGDVVANQHAGHEDQSVFLNELIHGEKGPPIGVFHAVPGIRVLEVFIEIQADVSRGCKLFGPGPGFSHADL